MRWWSCHEGKSAYRRVPTPYSRMSPTRASRTKAASMAGKGTFG